MFDMCTSFVKYYRFIIQKILYYNSESFIEFCNILLQYNENGTLLQTQSQYQNMTAEIHTHQHVYVVLSESGEVVAFPPFTGSLTNSSINEIVEMVSNSMNSQESASGNDEGIFSNVNDNDSLVTVNGNGVFTCQEVSNGGTTNFVNSAYPNFDNSDSDQICSFLLKIDDSSVCQVRVDFVDTQLLAPTNGDCLKQYLSIQGRWDSKILHSNIKRFRNKRKLDIQNKWMHTDDYVVTKFFWGFLGRK